MSDDETPAEAISPGRQALREAMAKALADGATEPEAALAGLRAAREYVRAEQAAAAREGQLAGDGDAAGQADDVEVVANAAEPAVTVRQAARALGLTREHVYSRIRAGTIRAIDGPGANGQGTRRLVPLAEIDRLLVAQGPRSHGEVKPEPPDNRPTLQLERVTQRLESTRAVLSDAVGALEQPDAGSWWGRRKRERERMARLEAALRAAHAAADAGSSEDAAG
jgi:hypothetical protein